MLAPVFRGSDPTLNDATVDPQIAGGDRIDHFRKGPRLLLEHPRGQGGRVIRGMHRTAALVEDRTVVVHLVHEVDRAAGFPLSRFDHRLVHPHPVHPAAAEAGEERRMDVDDAIGEFRGHVEVTEISAEAHEIDRVAPEVVIDSIRQGALSIGRDDLDRETRGSASIDACEVGSMGHNGGDLRVEIATLDL